MTWRIVNASEVGTSHIGTSRPCEDSCWTAVDTTSAGLAVLSMFVADGAGSAAQGGTGAEVAVQAAADFMADKLKQAEFGLNDDFAVECVSHVRARVYARAAAESLSARDFACTFLALISASTGTLVIQVGDGGVVLDVGGGLELAVVPMTGEYANMTHFVTDENAIAVLCTRAYPSVATKAAVFSDGLQRLALNMAANTVHEPFFSPFFKILAASSAEQEDELQGALVRFLASPAVNERTDDDKTLALAVLV